jgi:hypothetical protein
MIVILMHYHGLTLQEAVDYVGQLCEETINAFIENKKRLPSWGREIDDMVQIYVKGLQDWIVGYVCFLLSKFCKFSYQFVMQFFALELPDAPILRVGRSECEETPHCEVIAPQGLMFSFASLNLGLSFSSHANHVFSFCIGPFFVVLLSAQFTLLHLHAFDLLTPLDYFRSIFARGNDALKLLVRKYILQKILY